MKKIAASIINYNTTKDTIECINSLKQANLSNIQLSIVVLDNASTLDEKNKLEKYIKSQSENVTFLSSEKNLGFSEGNNVCIKEALKKGNEYILIINNDTYVEKDSLQHMINTFKQENDIGVVVPKIYFAKGYEYHKNYKPEEKGRVIWYAGGHLDWKNVIGYHNGVDEVDKGQFDSFKQTEFATGACMLVKKEVIRKTGMYDKRYYLYYEDNDWSMRIKQAGYKIMFTPYAKIWHKNASSSGGSGSALQDYYITRNRMLFGMSYAPLRSKISLLKESIRLLVFGRRWQKTGIKDYYIRRFGKGSYFK